MSAQAITGQSWEQLQALGAELERRREFLNQVYPFYACQNTADGGCGNAEAAQVNGTWGGRKTSPDCSSGNQYFGGELNLQWPNITGTAGAYNFSTYALSLEEKDDKVNCA